MKARIVKTDGNGDFTISLLRPGSYRLEVESGGIQQILSTRLRCRSIRISRLDVDIEDPDGQR